MMQHIQEAHAHADSSGAPRRALRHLREVQPPKVGVAQERMPRLPMRTAVASVLVTAKRSR